MASDKLPPPLTVELKVTGLTDVSRHRLVAWLREHARDLETRPVEQVPLKLTSQL